jgi:hypothetical protein
MLVSDGQVRLTSIERRQLAGITGIDPVHIKTVNQLNGFIHTQIEKLQCRGPAGCLAKRLLMSYLPVEPHRLTEHSEDELTRDAGA